MIKTLTESYLCNENDLERDKKSEKFLDRRGRKGMIRGALKMSLDVLCQSSKQVMLRLGRQGIITGM